MTVLQKAIIIIFGILAGIAAITSGRDAQVLAADFNIPAATTFNINDAPLNVPGSITVSGTLQASSGTVTISNNGNWSNGGVFTAGNGNVVFAGTNHAIDLLRNYLKIVWAVRF